ncbi:MAG: hypothetical protein AAF483_20870, partial [Planctomycetota bacterium]
MNYLRLTNTIALLSCFLLIPTSVFAEDPSPKAQYGTFQTHKALAETKPILDKMVEQDESIRQLLDRMSKARNGPDAKQFQQLYLKVEQYRRWIAWLDAYTEPAAIDFKYRESVYGSALTKIAPRVWGSPQGQKLQQAEMKALSRSQQKRVEALQKVIATLDSGDRMEAEVALDKIYDGVFDTAGILSPKQKQPYAGPITSTETRVRPAANGVRKARLGKAVATDKQKFLGYYRNLIQTVSAAKAQIGNGNIEYQGKQLDGPAAAEAFVTDFRNAHRGVVRITAFTYRATRSLGYGGGSYGSEGSEGSNGDSDGAATGKTVDAALLCNEFLDALGQFIAADIASTSEADAEKKYVRYKAVLADFVPRLANQEWLNKMNPTLSRLANQAGFRQELDAYDAATTDLLRWRERAAIAKAQARAQANNLKSAPDLARATLMTNGQYKGLYSKEYSALPYLQNAVPELVPTVEKALVGKGILLGSTIRLDVGSAIWMSRFEENFYSKLDVSAFANHAEFKDLASDLMATSGSEPLTILAAAALHSARKGQYESAGGAIESFTLEG